MKYYLYYATGKNEIIEQALFSILSIFQVDKIHERTDTQIIVYTDQPKRFSDFFKDGASWIKLVHVDERMANDFFTIPGTNIKNIHRLKIRSLQEVFKQYPDSKAILLDSDTYLLKPLQPVFDQLNDNETFLDKDEGFIFKFTTKHGPKRHKKILDGHKFYVDNKIFEPRRDFKMFNVGLIGLSHKLKHLLDEALKIHDSVYAASRYYNAEQFAIGHVFQTQTKLKTADHLVRHYWYLKEFQSTIKIFLEKHKNDSFENLLKAKMPTERLPSYEGFKKLTFKVPYKFKKKLFEMKLIKGPYVTFD